MSTPPNPANRRLQSFQETWRQLDRRVADLEALGRAASSAGSAVASLLSGLSRGARGGAGAGAGAGASGGAGGSWSQGDGAEATQQQQQQQQQQGAAADGPAGTWPGAGGGAAR